MDKIIFSFFIILIIAINPSNAQSNFNIIGKKKSVTIPFKLVNNLIILPIKLNGQELAFILDTGVSKSLLFNVVSKDSISLNQTKKIQIKGLGNGNYFNAIYSKNNLFRLKNIICPNFEIYLILNKQFDFSARMGVDINGLIGTDFLKDFVVEINYIKKSIKITKPEYYKKRKCKKCTDFDLLFQNRKPYIDSYVSSDKGLIPVRLLIDSGAGEALWLFEESLKKIKISKKNTYEFLGKGLSGNIFGKRAKVTKFKIGDYKFKNLIVSYPDSSSVYFLNKSLNRNGTLGSEILKRFHLTLDYKNKKITLKSNRNFKKPFYYNKSGLEIIYNGRMLIKEAKAITTFSRKEEGIITSYAYNFTFKNSYIISLVRPGSTTAIAGLKENDILLKINGKPVYEYTLQQLIQKLANKDGSKIKLLIDRNGYPYTFTFKLKDIY
ncbi:MAG: aspartyl protease family protein [Flavobacteriaceae bacterium]|nr:aspartyl protease family protein [Flavobacteriaceae bacterium]